MWFQMDFLPSTQPVNFSIHHGAQVKTEFLQKKRFSELSSVMQFRLLQPLTVKFLTCCINILILWIEFELRDNFILTLILLF